MSFPQAVYQAILFLRQHILQRDIVNKYLNIADCRELKRRLYNLGFNAWRVTDTSQHYCPCEMDDGLALINRNTL